VIQPSPYFWSKMEEGGREIHASYPRKKENKQHASYMDRYLKVGKERIWLCAFSLCLISFLGILPFVRFEISACQVRRLEMMQKVSTHWWDFSNCPHFGKVNFLCHG
jgi:hypothetical protein